MGKILTVYGPSGSGKSTFAVNLAEALAAREKLVAIVNCDINVGSLQVFFSETIENDMGILTALADKAEQPDKYLKQVAKKKNIYLLSCPNEQYDIQSVARLEKTPVENLLRKLSISLDYLIVDCTPDLVNGLTIKGIRMADYMFMCYQSTIKNCLWHNSHINTIKQLTDGEIISVLNEYNAGCTVPAFTQATGIEISAFLPVVANASFLENQGKTIWDEHGKYTVKYKAAVKRIADIIAR